MRPGYTFLRFFRILYPLKLAYVNATLQEHRVFAKRLAHEAVDCFIKHNRESNETMHHYVEGWKHG